MFRLTVAVMQALLVLAPVPGQVLAHSPGDASLDRRVHAFLESRRGTWNDMSAPEVDARTLSRLILENDCRSALEIGTCTGHSAIWMAWALSKTGGRLTTLEIDPERHRIAVENFREAGLADYVDARLADAHELLPQLAGPFDFVFADADERDYERCLVALWPKLAPGGCYTAHDVANGSRRGIREFLARLAALPDAATTIDRASGAGLSISFRRGQ